MEGLEPDMKIARASHLSRSKSDTKQLGFLA